MSDPADLDLLEAAALLRGGGLSSRELTEACLARIRERDGTHSHDGDPASINAWIRVYEEDALAAADRADARLAAGEAPLLCGIPIGLKDLYAVAGKPLTASSSVLHDVPAESAEAWRLLEGEGMVLLGHLHTHEFAAGGTTDQVGNPWDLSRSAGGSSGGSGAALAAHMTPAATGTDTAGSLRIPSHMCGTATIKPTLGTVSIRGLVPLAASFDHAGPMARTVADCEPLLAGMGSTVPRRQPRELRRVALSPRIGELDPDVADGLERALAALPVVASPPPPEANLEPGLDFLDLVTAEMLEWHRRLGDDRARYRPSIRGFLEHAEQTAMTAERRDRLQEQRRRDAGVLAAWLAEHDLDALVEPTLPIVARPRGHGYDAPFTDRAEISLTHYWNWVGLPVVALPAGVGSRSGLPTGVSLIGAPGADWDLLAWGAALQASV